MPTTRKNNPRGEFSNEIMLFLRKIIDSRDFAIRNRNLMSKKSIEAEIRFTNFKITDQIARFWSKYLEVVSDKNSNNLYSKTITTGSVEYVKASNEDFKGHTMRIHTEIEPQKPSYISGVKVNLEDDKNKVSYDAKMKIKGALAFGMKGVVSEEISLDKEEFDNIVSGNNSYRKVDRTRISYKLNKGYWRWDITKDTDGYQIELEILENFSQHKQILLLLSAQILNLLELLGEGEVYKDIEAERVQTFMNNATGDSLENNPVNFEPVHFGEIVSQTQQYDVSIKADGERRILIFYEGNMWLFNPRLRDSTGAEISIHKKLYLVKRGIEEEVFIQRDRRYADNLILDVELIRDEKSREDHIYFLDLIYFLPKFLKQGDNLGYLGNMKRALRLDLIRRLTNGTEMMVKRKFIRQIEYPIFFHRKEWIPIDGAHISTFFEANRYLLSDSVDGKDETPIKKDGLIFTPSGGLEKESLILKWKPRDMLSIDFHVDNGKCYVNDDNGKLTLFVPNGNFPVDESNFDIKHVKCDVGNYKNSNIVEAVYDHRERTFRAVRSRDDKSYPNHISVAQNIWNDIMAPVDKQDMTSYEKSNLGEFVSLKRWVDEGKGSNLIVFSKEYMISRWLANYYNRFKGARAIPPTMMIMFLPAPPSNKYRVKTRWSTQGLPFSSVSVMINLYDKLANYMAVIDAFAITGNPTRFMITDSLLNGWKDRFPDMDSNSMIESVMYMAKQYNQEYIYVEEMQEV